MKSPARDPESSKAVTGTLMLLDSLASSRATEEILRKEDLVDWDWGAGPSEIWKQTFVNNQNDLHLLKY